MAPRREHRQLADLGHAASTVAPVPAQASDARGMATPPQRTLRQFLSSSQHVYTSLWGSRHISKLFLFFGHMRGDSGEPS